MFWQSNLAPETDLNELLKRDDVDIWDILAHPNAVQHAHFMPDELFDYFSNQIRAEKLVKACVSIPPNNRFRLCRVAADILTTPTCKVAEIVLKNSHCLKVITTFLKDSISPNSFLVAQATRVLLYLATYRNIELCSRLKMISAICSSSFSQLEYFPVADMIATIIIDFGIECKDKGVADEMFQWFEEEDFIGAILSLFKVTASELLLQNITFFFGKIYAAIENCVAVLESDYVTNRLIEYLISAPFAQHIMDTIVQLEPTCFDHDVSKICFLNACKILICLVQANQKIGHMYISAKLLGAAGPIEALHPYLNNNCEEMIARKISIFINILFRSLENVCIANKKNQNREMQSVVLKLIGSLLYSHSLLVHHMLNKGRLVEALLNLMENYTLDWMIMVNSCQLMSCIVSEKPICKNFFKTPTATTFSLLLKSLLSNDKLFRFIERQIQKIDEYKQNFKIHFSPLQSLLLLAHTINEFFKANYSEPLRGSGIFSNLSTVCTSEWLRNLDNKLSNYCKSSEFDTDSVLGNVVTNLSNLETGDSSDEFDFTEFDAFPEESDTNNGKKSDPWPKTVPFKIDPNNSSDDDWTDYY
ncbi:Serine/threonine-protein phosphatase 6 regulatory subunit 2 [Trichinella murrelli]|uniref:Serine/threonine-protein phosphatase 6 regulatory subunit 2 n=1 Tax=Trichinella murrelli TaxID=144512 RepID=A0A0V0U7C0_9BILA|nr:Serine/threonine-protein phosphatase 6 regulatory subunit 2 [Trichinella murrelli]